jgi:hypothetical protein
VRLIVLHTAEGARTIESLGGYFQGNVSASSHVGADDKVNTIGEYVKRPNNAWTQANYNSAAVAIELCGFASWSRDEWLNNHGNMLANCAAWIAEEAAHFGIPISKLSASQAQGSGRGVCQHVDLGAGGGGHHDCGSGFPIDDVLDMARGGSSTPDQQEGEMLASAVAANGSTHVFRAKGKTVSYTYQSAGKTSWSGGKSGDSPAGFSHFADARGEIVGISAVVNDGDALHVFVECGDGNTYYTWQRKGESSWNGGKPGQSVAGLILFA